MTRLPNLAMVPPMEIILATFIILAVLYFIKGIRSPAVQFNTIESPETVSVSELDPQFKHDLLILAGCLFTQTDADEFQSQLDLFQADHKSFVEKYQAQYEFLEAGEVASLPIESIFIFYASELHDYLCNMDWTGESDPDQLKNFIQKKLDQVGFKHFDWTFLQRFEDSLDSNRLQRGDYIIHKMIAIDAQLQTIGYKLITIDVGSDAYLAFIIHEQDYAAIAHIQYDEFQLLAVSDWAKVL